MQKQLFLTKFSISLGGFKFAVESDVPHFYFVLSNQNSKERTLLR